MKKIKLKHARIAILLLAACWGYYAIVSWNSMFNTTEVVERKQAPSMS